MQLKVHWQSDSIMHEVPAVPIVLGVQTLFTHARPNIH